MTAENDVYKRLCAYALTTILPYYRTTSNVAEMMPEICSLDDEAGRTKLKQAKTFCYSLFALRNN